MSNHHTPPNPPPDPTPPPRRASSRDFAQHSPSRQPNSDGKKPAGDSTKSDRGSGHGSDDESTPTRRPNTLGERAAAAGANKAASALGGDTLGGKAAQTLGDAGGSLSAAKDLAKDRLKKEAMYQGANVVAPGAGEALRQAHKVNDRLNQTEIGRKALRTAEKIIPQRSRKLVNKLGFGAKPRPGDPDYNKDKKGSAAGSMSFPKKAGITAAAVITFPLIIILLVSSLAGVPEWNDNYALASQKGTEIPAGFVDIYKRAADTTSVPWTVLAGLAKVQTNHGAVSPYDDKDYGKEINRDPSRVEIETVSVENPDAVAPPATSGGNSKGSQIVDFAMQYLGTPYVYGGNEPGGFDCSGLMQYAYDHYGISLPHRARLQQKMGIAVPLTPEALQPGDLLFWNNPATHVAMYIGDNKYIHAPNRRTVVKIATMSSWRPDSARRILGTADGTAMTSDGATISTGTNAASLTPNPSLPYITPAVPNAADVYGARHLVAGAYASGGKGACFNDDPNATPSINPCTVPAIGSRDDEGHGLFLVRGDAPDLGGTDLQNIQASSDYIARRLAVIRASLEKEQNVNASSLDQTASDKFWATAVTMLPIADGEGQTPGCGAPSNIDGTPAPTNEVIAALFQCELEQVTTLRVADTATTQDGKVTFSELTGPAAVSELVSNALTVAWGYSQWGDAKCDPKATYAGVFPLTAEQATAHNVTNRCDVIPNVTAAAKIVAATEQMPIATRSNADGPYAPMFGGWAAFPAALGNEATRKAFAKNGPMMPWTMSESCAVQLDSWAEVATTQKVTPFAGVTADTIGTLDPTQRASLDAAYRALVEPANNPVCAGANDRQMLEVKQGALDNLEQDLAEPDGDDNPADPTTPEEPANPTIELPIAPEQAISNITGLKAYLDVLRSALVTAKTTIVWGTDAAVARLSSTGDGLETPGTNRTVETVNKGVRGGTAVEYAIYYGGILPEDPRAGTRPASLSGGDETGGDGGDGGGVPLGIVVERIDLSKYDLWPSGDEIKNLSSCGSAANTSDRARVFVVDKWEKLCRDAKNAGVNLGVNSSLRSKADQQRLYNQYGPGRAARPGRSNHERGLAFDVSNTGKPLTWMHAIVGCYNPATKSYKPYGTDINFITYANAVDSNQDTVKDVRGKDQQRCGTGQNVVKRVQTYGFIFAVCAPPGGFNAAVGIRCQGRWPSGQLRENWHLEVGKEIMVSGGSGGGISTTGSNFDLGQCGSYEKPNVNDPWSLQKTTYLVFRCALKQAGYDTKPPTARANGTGPAVFRNRSEQIASEAVVVGYCESSYSKKHALGDNPWGYGGVFQFGPNETRQFIPGGKKFDPLANIIGATKYFLYSDKGKRRFKGWSPWAPVNTTYGGANVAVKVPVLPRFSSTRAGYEGVYHPGPLPKWALEPMKYRAEGGCSAVFKGKPWPKTD